MIRHSTEVLFRIETDLETPTHDLRKGPLFDPRFFPAQDEGMRFFFVVLAGMVPITVPHFVRAEAFHVLRDELSISSNGQSNNLGYSYSFDGEDNRLWNLDADLTTSTSKSTSSTGTETTYRNTDASLSGSVLTQDRWSFFGAFSISNSPTDSLTSWQPSFGLGRRHFFSAMSDEGDLDGPPPFRASWRWRLSVARNTITQQTTVGRRTDTLSVRQSSLRLGLGLRPLSWLDLGLSYKKNSYDQNLDQFISNLSTTQAINRYGTGFASTLSSLSDVETGLTLTFLMGPNWDLELSSYRTKDATSTGAQGIDNSLMLGYQGEQWRFTLGGGQSSYDNSTTKTGYTLLGVEYEF